MEITYPFEQVAEPGATLEIAPGVHWIRMPLPFALDHINLWLLDEGDGWTIVDTGLNLDRIKQHWESVLATHCADKPVKRILVTHCHPDHMGLADWLERKTTAPVWATQGEILTANAWYHQLPGYDLNAMVDLYLRHGLAKELIENLTSRGATYKGRVDHLPMTYRRIFENQVISIGAHDWRVITGYGHSPEHASLYCATLGILIAGDMLLPRITSNISVQACNPDGNPIQQFLDSVDRFLDVPEDTLVLPSHGRPFHGAHTRVAQLHTHHRERFDMLVAACDTPKNAGDLLPILFNRELDAHQVVFAMGEAIAHLNYLEQAGELSASNGAEGILRYTQS